MTGPRITPEDHGPSGTFAALERTTPIVHADDSGELTTTSMRIANGTQHEHRAVLKLIRENLADFEEFGRVALEVQPFDTAGGVQHREVAILNEDQATLLMTFMRNLGVVKDFKKRLVREFSRLRRAEVLDTSDPIAAIEAAHARTGQAIEVAKSERAARIEAENHAKALEAPASAWKHLASAEGDYEVADAAKVLSRDPNIKIGRDRLFAFMAALGWIFRNRASGRWKAYQTQVENGRLTERFGKPFLHEPTGEMRLGDPTIRIRPKGMAELHKRLGGSGQLPLVAAS